MRKSYGDLLGYVHKGKHYCVGCAEQMARDRGLRISDDYLIQSDEWLPVYDSSKSFRFPGCSKCGVVIGYIVCNW